MRSGGAGEGFCLCVTCPCVSPSTASAERGRSSQGAPPAQDRQAVRGIEVMFSVSSLSEETSVTC